MLLYIVTVLACAESGSKCHCKLQAHLQLTIPTVYIQLKNYLASNSLLDTYQSGFCPYHSTEMALNKVLNDLHINTDSKKMSILVLLDLRLTPLTTKSYWKGLKGGLACLAQF